MSRSGLHPGRPCGADRFGSFRDRRDRLRRPLDMWQGTPEPNPRTGTFLELPQNRDTDAPREKAAEERGQECPTFGGVLGTSRFWGSNRPRSFPQQQVFAFSCEFFQGFRETGPAEEDKIFLSLPFPPVHQPCLLFQFIQDVRADRVDAPPGFSENDGAFVFGQSHDIDFAFLADNSSIPTMPASYPVPLFPHHPPTLTPHFPSTRRSTGVIACVP